MSFSFLKRFFIFFLSMGLMGCQLKVGEAPPPTINPKLTGTQCLSGVMIVAKDFVQGNATDQDLVAGWDCLINAVDKFKKYVRGRSENQYDIQELSTFLEKNFFDKNKPRKISPDLQVEMMRFKKLFLGGGLSQITRSELEQTPQIFESFKKVTLKINPYMSVITFRWVIDGRVHLKKDLPFFDNANLAFQSIAKDLGQMIQDKNENYELSHAVQFLRALSKFYGEAWSFLDEAPHYASLVKKVKKALAGGSEHIVSPKEWRKFLNLGARSYFQYLRYHYFIKNVSDVSRGERLSYIAKTAEESFGIIHELVFEKEKSFIDKEEIQDILFKLSEVWPIFKISNGFIDEIMKVKKVIVGGSEQGWSLDDIQNARSKVGKYRNVAERLFPYYSYLTLEENQEDLSFSEQIEYFSEFTSAMSFVSQQASELLESDYKYSDLVRLFEELDRLYTPKNPDMSYSTFLFKYQKVFQAFKTVSFSTDGDVVFRSEWGHLFQMVTQIGSSYLFYHYYVMPKSNTNTGIALVDRYHVFLDRALSAAKVYFSLKKTHQLSFEETWSLAKTFQELDIVPRGLSKESLKGVFSVATQNLLVSREQRLEGAFLDVVTVDGIVYFEKFYLQPWFLLEGRYRQIFREKESLPKSTVLDFLMSQAKGVRSYLDIPLRASLLELHSILNVDTNLSYDSSSRLIISGLKKDEYDYVSLNIINTMRLISKWAINSFSNSQGGFETLKGVTLDEIQDLYVKVRDFFIDLEMLRPNDHRFASNRFMEGNLFTPSARSDSFLSFNEAVELLVMVYSGMHIDQIQKKELKSEKCLPQAKLLVTTELARDCFLKVYKHKMIEHLGSLPDYISFIQRLEISEQDEASGGGLDQYSEEDLDFKVMDKSQTFRHYFDNVLLAASQILPNQEQIEVGDVFLVPFVLQYIEMLYSRFDVNQDGIISSAESDLAYPVFKGVIAEVLTKKSIEMDEEGLQSFFKFILYKGKIPYNDDELIKYWIEFKVGDLFGKQWKVRADRMKISQILADLARQVRSPGRLTKVLQKISF